MTTHIKQQPNWAW